MVRLQLEKSLPYPVEETTNDFQVLSQKETIVPAAQEAGGAEETAEPAAEAAVTVESTVLACVIHNPAVDAFCSPLVQRRQYPRRLTVWAMHVAAQAPSSGVACGLWQEEAEVIFAVFENGILSFAEVISSPDVVLTDLPQVLMSAELAGTPTTFCAVLLDPVLAHLRDSIAEFFGAPSEELRLEALHDANPEQPLVDLTPDSWRRELARMESAHKLRLRLAIAGVAYAAILVLVCAYLFLLQHQLQTVNNELASVRPKVNGILAQQTRWKSLEPAIEPQRYTVEVLYQIFLSLPSPDVRITQFEQSPTDFQVQGEAPDANQAIAMEEKLKAQPGLSQYHLEAANPTILPNDHAQFSISGKL